MAKKVTTVRLDEDLRERLREHAEDRGVSEAELIRQAIVFYLGWLHGRPTDEAPGPRTAPRPKGRGRTSKGGG